MGGTELNAVRTAEAFDPAAIDLSVFHLRNDGPLRVRYERLGVPLTHLPIPNLYSSRTFMQGLRLAKALRIGGFDVVHSHDIYCNIFAVPFARLLTNCSVIASRRWWYEAPRPGLVKLNRVSSVLAHRVLANSQGVADLLVKDEGVPQRKVISLPNFLSDSAFDRLNPVAIASKRREWGVPAEAFAIGIVARLSPVKNHSMLFEAMTKLDEQFHLVVVGDGPTRQSLENNAAMAGIAPRVHFVGEILAGHNLHQYFDVSVLCSLSEGFPNTVIEAMAAGVPVVATPVGGVLDAVQNGETGLLVQLNQPGDLAAAILNLRSDVTLRKRLGETARASVFNKYRQTVVIEQLIASYNKLLDRA